MTESIKKYYRQRVEDSEPTSFLWQVGKTVGGRDVSDEQIELIIERIVSSLFLDKNDSVLDIGCGNGLLTQRIAEYVSKVTGIELSAELCEIAKKYHALENITYINEDFLSLDESEYAARCTKVYLYEVIQHLNYQEADTLLSKLCNTMPRNSIIFIGGVLDIEKKWVFFDTYERRSAYFSGLLSGNEPLGTWYHKEFFDFLAHKHNLDVECITQDEKLYTSHYRFDCVLRKK